MTFRNFVLKRLIMFVPAFFLATILIFTLIHLAPGDPISIMFSTRPVSRELVEEIKQKLGLDQPIHVQYFIWVGKILQGDFGYSFLTGTQVSELIISRFWKTALLMLSGLTLSVIIAVVLGVVSATKQNSFVDSIISLTGLFGYSMPSFWLAMIFILVFGLWLAWFPVMGIQTIGIEGTWFDMIWDRLLHLVLPVISVAVGFSGYLLRIVRTSMLDVLRQDYITAARAKGVKEYIIIYKHALLNAMLPLITIVGISLGTVVSGSVVIETIFAWPGLGKLAIDMALQRDFPTLMGVSTILIGTVLLGNLLTDLLYALLDPRIKY